MATPQKITLSQSRDIPFNKLVLSNRNVRRVQAGVSIEELAEDIARRTLLQSLSVRPVLGEDGQPTDQYEVQAGRSEEHTSELQSLMRNSYAVFCLKQKKKQTDITTNN